METTNNNRPNAALINRQWFEAARSAISRADLAALTLAAVEYVLYGAPSDQPAGATGLAFAMIRPALDSDIERYIERCARNRQNAKGRKPLAASGSESQPLESNNNDNNNSNSNNNNNSNSISMPTGQEKERFVICCYFFSKGVLEPVEELNRFWDYYESLGWKNNKGAAIASKMAAARMWNVTGITIRPDELKASYARFLGKAQTYDVRVWSNYRGAYRSDDGTTMNLEVEGGADFVKLLEESYLVELRQFVNAAGCTALQYMSR